MLGSAGDPTLTGPTPLSTPSRDAIERLSVKSLQEYHAAMTKTP
jgi:hypothetical protein